MSKGVLPIPYIIALIIGVIVVAVLAYWFISSGGKGTGIGKEAECKARLLDMCTTGESARVKAQEVCTGDQLQKDNICKFCSGIIPNWDKTKLGCN